jgi:hypothetical protein
MTKSLPVLFFIFFAGAVKSQYLQQYFDGYDTIPDYSIIIEIDPDSNNIWQVGPPQKNVFNSAYSNPNVMVTDTQITYPPNNVSKFRFKTYNTFGGWGPGIMAMQWAQKLDMDQGTEGGIIEYSVDAGTTWTNVFNNPYVYNFYGYDPANADTLPSGEFAFSGTDSTWRDIWLCFDWNYFMNYDTVWFQFTFKSDSVETGKDGWMIDNMWAHTTIIHTAGNEPQKEYMKVYPTVTTGTVFLEGQKQPDYHIIEHMELMSADGRIVQRFGRAPVKFYVDISDHADGLYFLKVTTNIKTVTHPVILSRQR